MFFYLYRDVLGFMEPGHIEQLLSGEPGGIRMTETVLPGSAVLMAIPSIMVLLSLALKAKANRWVNIILGVAHLGILAGTLFVGNITALYIFSVVVEAALIALIIWHAWRWPKQQQQEIIPWNGAIHRIKLTRQMAKMEGAHEKDNSHFIFGSFGRGSSFINIHHHG